MGGMGETGGTNTGDGSNFNSDLLFSPSQANTSLKYGGLNNAINRDLLANRNRMRRAGAYNNTAFDFGSINDGSPVRIR
jgi:hypothetical protein